MGELCLLGYQIKTILFWDEFWPQGWPFISFKHIQLGNRLHKKIIPARVRAHPPSERVNWKKKKGVGWEGKMFHDFLVDVSRV